jgi:hypothetical protein
MFYDDVSVFFYCDISFIQVKLDHDDDDGDSEFEISDEEDEEEEVKKTLFLSGVVDPRSGAFSGP